MSIKLRITAAIVLPLLAMPVLAQDDDGTSACESRRWTGTYTVTATPQVGGPFLINYTFHRDGIFTGSFTGSPEQFLTTGSLTSFFGSWKCSDDGNIALSFIYAQYQGTGGNLILANHIRSTGLFEIVDRDTLQRIDLAIRVYFPGQDPADPNGGIVPPVNPAVIASTLKRLRVSEADLGL